MSFTAILILMLVSAGLLIASHLMKKRYNPSNHNNLFQPIRTIEPIQPRQHYDYTQYCKPKTILTPVQKNIFLFVMAIISVWIIIFVTQRFNLSIVGAMLTSYFVGMVFTLNMDLGNMG